MNIKEFLRNYGNIKKLMTWITEHFQDLLRINKIILMKFKKKSSF